MICISDNDIILKLSACNLMEDALEVLGATHKEVYVLPTARYKIGNDRGGKLAAKYGVDGVAAALAFISNFTEISQSPSPEEQLVLAQVEDIDDGEQILFSATAYFDSFILATGDKRSLRALCQSAACASIHDRLRRRVICLEQIIARLIPHLGFEEVRSRIVPARDCDTALKAVFGSGLMATEPNVTSHLSNRITMLRVETGSLLCEY